MLVRGIIRSARDAPTGSHLRAQREKREKARKVWRGRTCFVRYGCGLYSPVVHTRGGGIELVPLLTADVGASVPFSSVDRWVRVCDNKSEYIVVGIKTSYMCCVLTFFFSVCLATIFTLLQLV